MKAHRADAARLRYSAKERSRAVSKPTRDDQNHIKIMAKYIKEPTNQSLRQTVQVRNVGAYPDGAHTSGGIAIDERWGHQALEIAAATGGTLIMRIRTVRHEQGSTRNK